MPDRAIYLDNHATTRTDPRVVEAMLPYLVDRYGNPSSRAHELGQDAADAVDQARASVAASVGAQADDIVFTSGATESNRLAFEAALRDGTRRHVVTSAIEHKSVIDGEAARVTRVPVGKSGVVEPEAIRSALRPDTGLVSVMLANNEIGTIQPIAEIGRICRAAGVPLHCDATAGVGRIPFDAGRAGCDFASFSAHKFYGPKGVGALYVRRAAGRGVSRPGTPNVPGIAGLARALEICVSEMDAERPRLLALRRRLFERLRAGIEELGLNGDADRRLEGNLNVAIPGIDGRALVVSLRGLAVSSGAACASATAEPSHVLVAIGRSRAEAFASLRFGIGRFNTEADVDRAASIVVDAVRRLRSTARSTTAGA